MDSVNPSGMTGAEFVRAVQAGKPENRIQHCPEAGGAIASAIENIVAMGM